MFDVLIAGGGPAGLFLACELRLAGASPLVLERLPGPNPQPKANGLTGQVVRLLDHRGLYERCGGQGTPQPAEAFFFGALPLPLAGLGARNPMYLLPIPQRDLERVLGERAAELEVDLRRGHEVTSFDQSEDGVRVTVAAPHGEKVLEARYLVGCDGGHSPVRKEAGIAFPGITNDNLVSRAATVRMPDGFRVDATGHVLVEGLGELRAGFHRTETGLFNFAAFDPERPLINTMEWDDRPAGDWPGDGPPMTYRELEESVKHVLGVDVRLEPPPPGGAPPLIRRLCGRNTRLAEHYREGRVFLAGDAAHVHAASGGPGLNLALQDAANLGWKLAATLQGWAPAGLLDTYERERRNVGERVFMQTQAQTALMAPGGDVTALRQLFLELLSRRENVQLIADLLAGADVRYDMGHPQPAASTGWFVPPLAVTTEDGERTRLAKLLHDGRPALLDLTSGPALADALEPWARQVRRIPARADDAPAPALLIRPDGYVAWAGDDPGRLASALETWFGPLRLRQIA